MIGEFDIYPTDMLFGYLAAAGIITFGIGLYIVYGVATWMVDKFFGKYSYRVVMRGRTTRIQD